MTSLTILIACALFGQTPEPPETINTFRLPPGTVVMIPHEPTIQLDLETYLVDRPTVEELLLKYEAYEPLHAEYVSCQARECSAVAAAGPTAVPGEWTFLDALPWVAAGVAIVATGVAASLITYEATRPK